MQPGDTTTLTYADFVRLRASALRALHAAQATQALVRANPASYVPTNAEALTQQAVDTAQMLLTAVLDRWNRSIYNRSV